MKIRVNPTHTSGLRFGKEKSDFRDEEYGIEGAALELDDLTPQTKKEVIIRKKKKHAFRAKQNDGEDQMQEYDTF